MMKNVFTRFDIIDRSNLISNDFALQKTEINKYQVELSKKQINYYEQELCIEVIDGSNDQGNRKINTDFVCAVNMTREKIATYSGSARWYCFNNIEIMNVFLEGIYNSLNFEVAQVEYDMNDLDLCLASSKDLLRIINKTDNIYGLNKDIYSLLIFHNYTKADLLAVNMLCDQIESMVNRDCTIITSSVRTFLQLQENSMEFFYTEVKADLEALMEIQNQRFVADECGNIESISFDSPDYI